MPGYSALPGRCRSDSGEEEALLDGGVTIPVAKEARSESPGSPKPLDPLLSDTDDDSDEVQDLKRTARARSFGRGTRPGSLLGWRAAGALAAVLVLAAVAWRSDRFTPAKLDGDVTAVAVGVPAKGWKPLRALPLPFNIHVIHIPEMPYDAERLESIRKEYDDFAEGGRLMVRTIKGVDPQLWADHGKGRLKEYMRAVMEMRQTEPWWKAISVEDPVIAMQKGRAHHVGCLGSHFLVWWLARGQSEDNILVSEVDGTPWRFATATGGCPGDFLPVARASVEQAPPDWHVIHLDQGGNCVEPGVVSRVIRVPGATTGYDMRPWVGGGCAGASLMLMSKRWLLEFPDIIKEHGTDMVDAWIGHLCQSRIIVCYTLQAQAPQLSCPEPTAEEK